MKVDLWQCNYLPLLANILKNLIEIIDSQLSLIPFPSPIFPTAWTPISTMKYIVVSGGVISGIGKGVIGTTILISCLVLH